MFVERVTREQMKMFLETFACCSEQKNLVMRLNYAGKEPYLDVTRYSNGMMYTDSYYDLTVHIAVTCGTNSFIHSLHMSTTVHLRHIC